ncbi:hypothetical protein JHK82_039304 [Glycine max]|nr:hypothetical protein JHK82_039304 [Glycine max]
MKILSVVGELDEDLDSNVFGLYESKEEVAKREEVFHRLGEEKRNGTRIRTTENQMERQIGTLERRKEKR